MTLVDALLALVRAGGALAVLRRESGSELRLRLGGSGVDEAEREATRRAIAANKPAVIELMDPEAARTAFGLPADLQLPPVLGTIVAAYSAAREEFTDDEHDRFEERAAVRELGGCPRWFAELAAVEDVMEARGGQRAGEARDSGRRSA